MVGWNNKESEDLGMSNNYDVYRDYAEMVMLGIKTPWYQKIFPYGLILIKLRPFFNWFRVSE